LRQVLGQLVDDLLASRVVAGDRGHCART
jgi:hypothetical protein